MTRTKHRTYEQIGSDARKVLTVLRRAGLTRTKINQTIRFHVTIEELVNMNKYLEGRQMVSSGTGHIAYAGQKISLFGIPIVTEQGEVENYLI